MITKSGVNVRFTPLLLRNSIYELQSGNKL